MTEATHAKWSLIFAKHGILPPFEQLGRPTYHLTNDERGETTLAPRFTGRSWPHERFFAHLRQRGWTHDVPFGNCIERSWKAFPFADVKAVVRHTAFVLGDSLDLETAHISMIGFAPMDADLGPFFMDHWRLPLGKVDARCVSEVVYDLEALGEA